jgi:glucokinase
VAPAESRVLVYDVGGSHISAAVFDREDCTVEGVVTEGYPSEQNIDTFLNVFHSLGTRAARGQTDIPGVSIAMPGPFDYERGVSWIQHKLAYLYGFDLRRGLAARLGKREAGIRFLNDGAAYLLGEITAGSAQGVCRAVAITLGTGIGSAFAVDGHVVREGTGVPPGGEIWNLPYLGGILEDQISTRAIRQSYESRAGVDREVADIAACAAEDAIAGEVFSDFGRTLGTGLRTVLDAFSPQVIVLGGGISRSAQLFLCAAQAELETPRVELRVSSLGEIAPLVGAGAAWFESERCVQPTADDAGLHTVAKPI